jgi:DNA-binding winged helix-turn-helix (wHTH) protein/tetratricopeptide (TPR) repeat protein
MQPDSTSRKAIQAYRFGDYEARVWPPVLLRRGHRVRVQELPFRLLIALLEQPATVLNRDDLKVSLWGEETFVDVDGGLRVAAAKLREALGDSAVKPKFIRTVFGRGYEFIGTVEKIPEEQETKTDQEASPEIGIEAAAETGIEAEKSTHHGTLLPAPAPSQSGQEAPARDRHNPYLLWGAAALVLCAALAAVFFFLWRRNQAVLTGSHLVLVGGVVNSTGNTAFDGTLSRALRVKLEESPFLLLVNDRQLVKRIAHPDSAPLESEMDACRALRAEALLRGEISAENSGYDLSLSAWKCSSGDLLVTLKTHADSESVALASLNAVSLDMRQRLGESRANLKSFNVPIAQATTDSISALKSFARGEEKYIQGQEYAAIPDYKLAVDLDPNFALAYARLGAIYHNAGELGASSQYTSKAFELRNRTTDRERLYITAHYYDSVTGELDKLSEAYELWHSVYPRDPIPLNNLAWTLMALGDTTGAVRYAKEAVLLDPSSNFFDSTLAMSYFRAGDYNSVQQLCSAPAHTESATFVFYEACYLTAVEQGNQAAQTHVLEWAAGRPEASGLLNDRAWTAMYAGKFSAAKSLFQQDIASALHSNLPDVAAQAQLDYAVLLADSGRPAEARAQALQALRISPANPTVLAFAALAIARSGDTALAEKLSRQATKSAPLATLIQSAILPSVRAAIELEKHQPQNAVNLLKPVERFDFCSAMQLAPAYYRGLANEAASHPQDAVADFQRILDHRAVAPNSLYIPLAMLELAKLSKAQGDVRRSGQYSQKLRHIWADADNDFIPLRSIPIEN